MERKAFAWNWIITGLIVGLVAIGIFLGILNNIFTERARQDANKQFSDIYTQINTLCGASTGEEGYDKIQLPDIIEYIYTTDDIKLHPSDIDAKVEAHNTSVGKYLCMKLRDEKPVCKALKCDAEVSYLGQKKNVMSLADKIVGRSGNTVYPLDFSKKECGVTVFEEGADSDNQDVDCVEKCTATLDQTCELGAMCPGGKTEGTGGCDIGQVCCKPQVCGFISGQTCEAGFSCTNFGRDFGEGTCGTGQVCCKPTELTCVPPTSTWRAGYLTWVEPENLKTMIQEMHDIGLDTVVIGHPNEYRTNYALRDADQNYPESITYAHGLGMKVFFLMDWKDYVFEPPDNYPVHKYMINPPNQYETAFVTDTQWVLDNYDIDGLELEEPVIGGSEDPAQVQLRTDYLNGFFTRMKVIIDAYKVSANKPDFKYGFNSPSLGENIPIGGIDEQYISDNRLFDYIAMQSSFATLGEMVGYSSGFSSRFPNLVKVYGVYVWWASLMDADACSWANGVDAPTTQWSMPACYNQALFQQVDWLAGNDIPFGIWPAGSLSTGAYYYPGEPTPGANAGEKVKYVLAHLSAPTIPSVDTCTQIPGQTCECSCSAGKIQGIDECKQGYVCCLPPVPVASDCTRHAPTITGVQDCTDLGSDGIQDGITTVCSDNSCNCFADGVNDQEQINEAIILLSAASSSINRGTVHLNPGTYKTLDYIYVKQNIILEGCGSSTTISAQRGINSATSTPGVCVRGRGFMMQVMGSNTAVINLDLNGNMRTGNDAAGGYGCLYGIQFGAYPDIDHVTIRNINIYGMPDDGITGNANNVVIDNIHVSDTGHSVMGLGGGQCTTKGYRVSNIKGDTFIGNAGFRIWCLSDLHILNADIQDEANWAVEFDQYSSSAHAVTKNVIIENLTHVYHPNHQGIGSIVIVNLIENTVHHMYNIYFKNVLINQKNIGVPFDGTRTAIYIKGATNVTFDGLTVYDAYGDAIRVNNNENSIITVKNSILEKGSGYGIYGSGNINWDVSYNVIHGFASGPYGGNAAEDIDNIYVDPLFANPANNDFHLQSPYDRWSGAGWVTTDTAVSPAIDKGDPASSYANEMAPNGGRVNMGYYGNTQEASKSSY
ncbi:MAG: hypothetical protein V1718_01825 [archaeon]